jgi:hypothetical protein
MVLLHDQRSADKLSTCYHCHLSVSIDQLDKADAPLIPETYIFSPSWSKNHPRVQLGRARTGQFDPTTLPETEPARVGL